MEEIDFCPKDIPEPSYIPDSIELGEPQDFPNISQADFFRQALEEAAALPYRGRAIGGVLLPDFQRVTDQTEQQLKKYDSTFSIEYIFPRSYRPPAVEEHTQALPYEDCVSLYEMSLDRLSLISKLVDTKIMNRIKPQVIPPGVLNPTPFAAQRWKGCDAACFRMIFEGITGCKTSDNAFHEAVKERYGSLAISDHEYLKLFQTETFRRLFDKEVTNVEMVGIDLKFIHDFATKLKRRRPQSQIYSTVNLASSKSVRGVWHSVVLLRASTDYVVVIDPVLRTQECAWRLPKEDFIKRWADTYNRAQVVITA